MKPIPILIEPHQAHDGTVVAFCPDHPTITARGWDKHDVVKKIYVMIDDVTPETWYPDLTGPVGVRVTTIMRGNMKFARVSHIPYCPEGSGATWEEAIGGLMVCLEARFGREFYEKPDAMHKDVETLISRYGAEQILDYIQTILKHTEAYS